MAKELGSTAALVRCVACASCRQHPQARHYTT